MRCEFANRKPHDAHAGAQARLRPGRPGRRLPAHRPRIPRIVIYRTRQLQPQRSSRPHFDVEHCFILLCSCPSSRTPVRSRAHESILACNEAPSSRPSLFPFEYLWKVRRRRCRSQAVGIFNMQAKPAGYTYLERRGVLNRSAGAQMKTVGEPLDVRLYLSRKVVSCSCDVTRLQVPTLTSRVQAKQNVRAGEEHLYCLLCLTHFQPHVF